MTESRRLGPVARQRWAWLLSCGGFAIAMTPLRGRGESLTASIEVEREETALDCPDGAELTSRVEAILQRRLTDGAPAGDQVRIWVGIRRDSIEYVAQLRFGGAKLGERVLHDRGPDCGPLADALSVTISLVLDRELQRSTAEPPHPPSTPMPAAAAVPQPARTTSIAELRASSGGGLESGFGDSPSPLVTSTLGLLVRDHWMLTAGLDTLLPSSSHFGAGEVRTSLLRGTAAGCHGFGSRYLVGPCGWFGIGRLHGVGAGYDEDRSMNLLWTAVGGGLVVEGPVMGRVFWDASGGFWAPLRRQSFSVQNAGSAWGSRPLNLALVLRFGVRVGGDRPRSSRNERTSRRSQ